MQAVADQIKDYGCIQFPTGNTGVQMGGWYRKEIKTLADLKGLKMRVSGLAGQVLGKLGVVGQQIAGGEIYQALERGTIDAAEWVGPYDDEKIGIQKVAKYYYYPGWWEGGPQLSTVVNMKEWESLPKAYKSIFESACAEANVHMLASYDAKNPQALKRLVGGGAQLRQFSKPIMEAAQKAAFEIYDEAAEKSPHFKRIYSQWLKFRADQFLWFRVAEMGYDNFTFNSASRPTAK
jgi:TRAP-type mannitol/chloroaromatic compound transport system substrate-binding protein